LIFNKAKIGKLPKNPLSKLLEKNYLRILIPLNQIQEPKCKGCLLQSVFLSFFGGWGFTEVPREKKKKPIEIKQQKVRMLF
jgi:hypothetical protein